MGLPYRILNMNHKKELLRSLWVIPTLSFGFGTLGVGLRVRRAGVGVELVKATDVVMIIRV